MPPVSPAPLASERTDPSRIFAAATCGAAFALASLRLAGLVSDMAVDVPYGDQWDTLQPLFDRTGPIASFLHQHGPHRLGLGGVATWLLYNASSWDVRAESWACAATLGLTAAIAVCLAARLRGRLSWTDAIYPLLLLSPVSWETMLLTPFIAHSILPLLLVFLLAAIWSGPPGKGQQTTIALLGGASLFSGFGFCGAFASAGLLLLKLARPSSTERGLWKWQLLALALFLGVLGTFMIGYRWDPAVPGWRFPMPNWWDYARFPALMFTSLLGWRAITPLSAAVGGALLVLCLGTWLQASYAIWQRRDAPRDRAVWVLIGTSLLYAGFTAIGRLPVGLEAAFMWRYTVLMLPAICGLALAATPDERAVRSWRNSPWPALLGLALACAIWANFGPERRAAAIAHAKRIWIAEYLRTGDLVTTNATTGFYVFQPAPDSPVIAARLHHLERERLSFLRTQSPRRPALPPPEPPSIPTAP